MDTPAGAIDELHFDLSKIMLTELSGQTLETYERLGLLRAERGDQRAQGSLAALIACFPHSSQNLQRCEIGCVQQNLQDRFPGIHNRTGRPTRFGLSDPISQVKCPECGKDTKLIKRSQISGQEKYESDKDRRDAETIAKSKRGQAKAEQENVEGSQKSSAYFKGLAQKRDLADKIRAL